MFPEEALMAAERLSILVVDDEEAYSRLVERHLASIAKWTITTTIETNPAAVIANLAAGHYDVVLLDYMLGESNGVQVLQAIRLSGAICPVIALTGRGSESVAAEFLRAGADDYLVKSALTAEGLSTAIERALVRHDSRSAIRDLSERDCRVEMMSRQLADTALQLTKLSRLDGLTQVLNRAAWLETIGLEHERSVRYGCPYCVIMIDVDHFKLYNDSQGHQAGDECLRRLAQSFIDACRGTDLIGRYGGEEFVILAPETDFEGGLTVAHRVRQAVNDLQLPHGGLSPGASVTVSVGIAAGPQGGWEHALKSADDALYDAKKGGRNRVCGRQCTSSFIPMRGIPTHNHP